jgi:hypothetical protein
VADLIDLESKAASDDDMTDIDESRKNTKRKLESSDAESNTDALKKSCKESGTCLRSGCSTDTNDVHSKSVIPDDDGELSDRSHHSNDLSQIHGTSSSDESFGLFEPVKSKKKKKRPIVTSSVDMTPLHDVKSCSISRDGNKGKQPSCGVPESTSCSDQVGGDFLSTATLAPDPGDVLQKCYAYAPAGDLPPPPVTASGSSSSGGTSQAGKRQSGRHSVAHVSNRPTVNPKPTFCEHPVIITDKKENDSARLFSLKWKLADILQSAVGSVRSIKFLSRTKVVVGCQNAKQQDHLLKLSNLGGLPLDFKRPTPSVEGVIQGVPSEVSDVDLLSKVECCVDGDNEAHVQIPIKHASRLTFKDGKPSQSVKFTFETTRLPSAIVINKLEYPIRPFVAQIIRCYRCNKLGHAKKDCTAKQEVCSNCGSKDHKRSKCDANNSHCLNCGESHSAAYLGCSARKTLSLANKIRAEAYMPRAQAIQQAKKVMSERCLGEKKETSEPPVPNAAWKPEHQSTRITYATVASGLSPSVKGKPKTDKTLTDPQVSGRSVDTMVPSGLASVEGANTLQSKLITSDVSLLHENKTLKQENKLLREEIKSLRDDMQRQNDRFLQEIQSLKTNLRDMSLANKQELGPHCVSQTGTGQLSSTQPTPTMPAAAAAAAADPNLIALIQQVVLGVIRNYPVLSPAVNFTHCA